MLRLKQTDVTPPGSKYGHGWHFVGDGTTVSAGTLGDLIRKVTEQRIANGQPIADLDAQIQDWICRNTQARCKPVPPQGEVEKRKVRGADVLRFLWAMGEWMRKGGFVSQEEADRRAETCSGCRLNVDVDDFSCFGCTNLVARVFDVVGNRSTRFDGSLKQCAVCACSNAASAWVPLEVLQRAHGELEFPADTGQRDSNGNPVPCWKRQS